MRSEVASTETVVVTCVDYHTAGEPFRIVTSEIPDLPGATVAERREHAGHGDPDAIRRLLCHEPRGHADMYGCFLVPPDDDDADLGALFWHKDGYSTACGHGTIALGVWAVHTGLVPAKDTDEVDVVIDVPSGRVRARLRVDGGVVRSVVFRNVPSYVIATNVPVHTSSGEAGVSLVYGGAIYATVPAAEFGMSVTPERLTELIAVGREIRREINGRDLARHRHDPRLSGLYGTVFYDELQDRTGALHQRNVTVFADGQVDRSPCGSATAARVAELFNDGRLVLGQDLIHDSIIGTRFRARASERVRVDDREAVIAEVEGMAYRTGEHVFTLDADDPLSTGFVLR